MAKISALTDDFNDGSIGGIWSTAGTVSESGGVVRLTASASGGILQAVTTYDLTNSKIAAHVTQVTQNGISGTMASIMAVALDGSNELYMGKLGGNIIAGKLIAGVDTVIYSDPFNIVIHPWWRISHDGAIRWEVSPDGVAWTTIGLEATPFAITNLLPYFYASFSGFDASATTFNINVVNPGVAISASGASTSSGTASLLVLHALTASGASTSTGSAAFTIPPPSFHSISASGDSTSSGNAILTIIPVVASTHQISASGASESSGSAVFVGQFEFTASGVSSSSGSANLTILPAVSVDGIYIFEPPVVYDNPPYHIKTRGRELVYARHRPSQPRGRTVLKLSSATRHDLYPATSVFPDEDLFPQQGGATGENVYVTVDSPTVDQVNSADIAYLGGHIYTIDAQEATALVTAGYTVTFIANNQATPIDDLSGMPV